MTTTTRVSPVAAKLGKGATPEQVKFLEEQGLDVKVQHLRPIAPGPHNYYEWALGERPHLMTAYEAQQAGRQFQPNRGETHVILLKDGATASVGVASCHYRDTFDRHIGLQVALGRAIQEYEEEAM